MASHHPAYAKYTERAGWAGCKVYLPAASPTTCVRSVQPVTVLVNSMLKATREKENEDANLNVAQVVFCSRRAS